MPVTAQPIGAVTADAVIADQATITAPLQAIVDTANAASADLRTQRDALITQRDALNAQITDLNNQIAAAEGPGAAMARNAIAAINQAMRPPPNPISINRRLGGRLVSG